MLNPSWLVLDDLQVSKSNTVWKMLNVQEGRFADQEAAEEFLKYLLSIMQEEFFVEKQVLNTDEIILFYEDISKWTYRMWVASKAPGCKSFKDSKFNYLWEIDLKQVVSKQKYLQKKVLCAWVVETLVIRGTKKHDLVFP